MRNEIGDYSRELLDVSVGAQQLVGELAEQVAPVLSEFCQGRKEDRPDRVLRGRRAVFEILHLVVELAELSERLVVKNIAHVVSLLREFLHAFGPGGDQGIELLRTLAEYLHRERVPLGAVLDLPEGVDGVPEHALVVSQRPVCIGDRDT